MTRVFLIPVCIAMGSMAAISLMGGCATTPRVRVPVEVQGGEAADRQYDAMTASALVFDPPAAARIPPLDLSRGPRQPSAFLGFDQAITEYYSVFTDDTQSTDPSWDGVTRESVSVRTGVRTH